VNEAVGERLPELAVQEEVGPKGEMGKERAGEVC